MVTTLGIIFGSLIIIVAIVANTVGSFIRKDSETTAGEEARLLQEMHQQLGRLERRIETLETILAHPPAVSRKKDLNT